VNFIVNITRVSLGYRSFIERAAVLIKELVRNKIDSSYTFRHCPILKGLIPRLLENV